MDSLKNAQQAIVASLNTLEQDLLARLQLAESLNEADKHQLISLFKTTLVSFSESDKATKLKTVANGTV